MEHSNLKTVRQFFSNFRLQPLDASSFMLSSSKEKMLVRLHMIHRDDADTWEEVIALMDSHLSFDRQYIAPLLEFQRCEEGVRAFYAIDQLSLREEVENRGIGMRYFEEEELWVLLSSVVDSLLYLQEKGLIYGVLSSSKIFVSDQIRLMDPSAFNLAPVDISRISFHSPEIAQVSTDIDFGKSDVYLLGLCMLEAASLTIIDNKVSQNKLDLILKQVNGRYSNELSHVLDHLLQENSQVRPSFEDIKEYIAKEIQIQSSKVWPAQALCIDSQDLPAAEVGIQCIADSRESVDYLQPEKDYNLNNSRKKSQYDRARGMFLYSPPLKDFQNIPSTNRTKQTVKSTIIRGEKISKGAYDCKSQVDIRQFKLKSCETVAKRKRPRAVQIKNRNAEEVRRVQSYQSQQIYTDPTLRTLLRQEQQMAHEFFSSSHLR